MSDFSEAIGIFQQRFEIISDGRKIDTYSDKYPEFLHVFWAEVGFGHRSDGFIWIINPDDFTWLSDLLELKDLIPFARNSFDEIYFLSFDGACSVISVSDRGIGKVSVNFETTLLMMSRRDSTDDEVIYERHTQMWESGHRIKADECYCLSPAIPLGGSYEDSDVYVGKIKEYFQLISQM